MSETRSSTLLQSQYLLEIEQAKLDQEANGDYTKEGLTHLKNAGQLQLSLAEITEGDVTAQHKQMGEELFRQVLSHMKRLGLTEDKKANEGTRLDSKKASHQSEKSKDMGVENKKTADGEMEGFIIEDYVVRPGDVSIDQAADANPDTVKALKSAIYDDFPQRFPKLKGYQSMAIRHRLLYGPPGSGKTFLCKGLSTYLNEKYPGNRSCFFLLPCSEIKSKYVGTAEKRIREVFRAAEKYDFSVICIDEVDALCPPRSSDNKVNYTTTLLELIDGVQGKTRSMVILATNHPENIDSALISRIGHRDFVDYPSHTALESFLRKEKRITSGLGQTQEEREKVIQKLALCGEKRHFSFRNMNVLCDIIYMAMKDKLEKEYPDGSNEEIDFIPLSEDEIDRVVAQVNTDFNPNEYAALLAYRNAHL